MPADEERAPAALVRLWRLPATGSGLGRPAALDTERVVRAGVALADRDGLGAATLPKIAKQLGVSPMSLYRHVGSKDELLALMRDFALGDPPDALSAATPSPVETADTPDPDAAPADPSTGRPPWRRDLRRWAVAQRLVNHRRPWLPRLPLTGPPSGPHEVAWMEAGLSALGGTGLDWGAKVGALTLVSGYVRHTSLLSQEQAEGRSGTDMDQAEAERVHARALSRLIAPDRFPQMARLLASGLFEAVRDGAYDDPASDPDFLFGLERLLDGIAVAVADARDADG
ncbi:TetR/AcrR family transcriptional regulator [Streptomyces sp. Z26]|uniref:TetR/AcrR family transcriptional regulator n=1 Tax=Streptomyces TaxID=1883 RepID=UPI000EF16C23|nr:TetR/AcrR family transcriptional regulator [Streptomyces sp. Z26]RLL67327.1 TetR/AcrR family transcriptional regulator [Streptomyces sp. Z26]